MPTITVEITEEQKNCLDQEVASGRYADCDSAVRQLLELGMHSQRKRAVDAKLKEALKEIERGEFIPWHKGDAVRLGEEPKA